MSNRTIENGGIIECNGYVISQNIDKNCITINLPQTMSTLLSTAREISYTRKLALSEEELYLLLVYVITMFEPTKKLGRYQIMIKVIHLIWIIPLSMAIGIFLMCLCAISGRNRNDNE